MLSERFCVNLDRCCKLGDHRDLRRSVIKDNLGRNTLGKANPPMRSARIEGTFLEKWLPMAFDRSEDSLPIRCARFGRSAPFEDRIPERFFFSKHFAGYATFGQVASQRTDATNGMLENASVIFGVGIDFPFEDKVDNERIDQSDRKHEHSGTPE
jgi:hypothetical protein